MRLQQWGGLLTNVSPYAVPAGGAVQQVNLTCSVAGQLTIRDGMRPVAFTEPTPQDCLDVAGYSFGGTTRVLVFTADGHLQIVDSPAYGDALGTPFLPDLPYGPNQVHVGYDYRFNEGGDNLPPEPTTCFTGIIGGYPTTTSWPVTIQAECPNGITEWFGGTPTTTEWPCGLHFGTELCPTDPDGVMSYDGLFGGLTNTASWPACVTSPCPIEPTNFYGGDYSTYAFPADVRYGRELCPCP